MTGEIGRDVREQEGKKGTSETERETGVRLDSNIFFLSGVVFFILAHRKLSSGESGRFPLLLLSLLTPAPPT